MTTPRLHQEDPAAAAEAVREIADRIRKEVGKVIVGQEEVLEEVLLAIFCGGHVIIVDGAVGTWHHGNAGGGGRCASRDLVPHLLDHLCCGTDEHDALFCASAGKTGVL